MFSTGPPVGAKRAPKKNVSKLFTCLAIAAGLRPDEDIGIYANVMT